MSHVDVTLIGSPDDLDWIYENCTTDSSSETSAEQAFGYDYLSERCLTQISQEKLDSLIEEDKPYANYDWAWKESDRNKIWFTTEKITKCPYNDKDYIYKKTDKEAAWILNGQFNVEEILDLRPRKDWVNVGWDNKKQKHKTKEEIIEWFKQQPNDTTFFVCDAHL